MATGILLALWSENGFGGMTMAEYIEREKVIHEIDTWLDSVGTVLVGKGLSYYGELLGCVEDVPAADAAPVHHGRNETQMNPVDEFICSECGFTVQDFEGYNNEEEVYYGFNPHYCPNCGVKMDGGETP